MPRTRKAGKTDQDVPTGHIEEPSGTKSNVGQVSKAVTKASAKGKRGRDAVDKPPAPDIDTEQSAPPKRARTAKKNLSVPEDKPAARHSARNNVKAPTMAPKRKRRTKEQIASDNAAAEIEKLRLKVLEEEKREQMRQLDLEEDVNRIDEDTGMIRKFTDLDQKSGSSEEEFDGYNDVVSDLDSSNSEEDVSKICQTPANNLKRNHNASQKRPEVTVDGRRQKSGGGKNMLPSHQAFVLIGSPNPAL
ncbi:hypothetical protein B0H34DRAFT_195237 [Crassisporium funariophilum]|nr:hypothetical protein B0H34DRAFT_195237 [Crassisporium funariophilum]